MLTLADGDVNTNTNTKLNNVINYTPSTRGYTTRAVNIRLRLECFVLADIFSVVCGSCGLGSCTSVDPVLEGINKTPNAGNSRVAHSSTHAAAP